MRHGSRWGKPRLVALLALAGPARCTAHETAPTDASAERARGFVPPAADLEYLRELARDVIAAARVAPPRSTVGFPLVTPAGRGAYPAFWVRDFSLSLDCGLIPPAEIAHHLRLVAHCQNGPAARELAHGLSIPPFAIPDHVTLEGGAVFYPGTYSSGDDQGDGSYGIVPPADDHYEFIHIAYALYVATGTPEFLHEPIDGLPLLERLVAAFAVPASDPESGAVVTDETRRSVGFGFCDGIVLTGALLFPTLLRERAACELSELCVAAGAPEHSAHLLASAAMIRSRLAATFTDPGEHGFLIAATVIGRQPDVWGTLFALQRVVLSGETEERARAAIVSATRLGKITFEAAVRHVPTNFDAAPNSAWELTVGVAHGTYQNGAYWHTPTGWLIAVVARSDAALAAACFKEYVAHLRRGDFRLGPDHEAPWECFGRGGRHAQNGAYMTSVTVPLAALDRLAAGH